LFGVWLMDVRQLGISEEMIHREKFIERYTIMMTRKLCDHLNRLLNKGRSLNGGKRRAASMQYERHRIVYQEFEAFIIRRVVQRLAVMHEMVA
jgi:hypothetical protein